MQKLGLMEGKQHHLQLFGHGLVLGLSKDEWKELKNSKEKAKDRGLAIGS